MGAAGLVHARIVVIGAPVSDESASEIGADGYASDAGAGVEIAKRVLSGSRRVRSTAFSWAVPAVTTRGRTWRDLARAR